MLTLPATPPLSMTRPSTADMVRLSPEWFTPSGAAREFDVRVQNHPALGALAHAYLCREVEHAATVTALHLKGTAAPVRDGIVTAHDVLRRGRSRFTTFETIKMTPKDDALVVVSTVPSPSGVVTRLACVFCSGRSAMDDVRHALRTDDKFRRECWRCARPVKTANAHTCALCGIATYCGSACEIDDVVDHHGLCVTLSCDERRL